MSILVHGHVPHSLIQFGEKNLLGAINHGIQCSDQDIVLSRHRAMPALYEWCRRVTSGYPGVDIVDMTESWRSGLAFCAILARFRPDLVDYAQLQGASGHTACALAFSIGEQQLGIPALLDTRDMQGELLDRLSIITYLAQLYHRFSDQVPLPARRSSLHKDDANEKIDNVSSDSGLENSCSSSRQSSPTFYLPSEQLNTLAMKQLSQ